MMQLRRYWFILDGLGAPTALNLGCGVTACSHDDAVRVLMEKGILGEGVTLRDSVEDVDVSTLDRGHVLPNMGSVLVRAGGGGLRVLRF
jgi:hypothetical protein